LKKKDHSFYPQVVPRVSLDHVEARRRQILDAARRCFVRDGFHMTSMQDVLDEADLSAGAVYRYFPSKEELIYAIADAALADLSAALRDIWEAENPPPLDELFGRLLGRQPPLDGARESASLMIQVWAEGMRSPALAARYRQMFDSMLWFLEEVVANYQERHLLSRTAPPRSIARALAALLHGFMVQRALTDGVEIAMFQEALRALLTSTRPRQSSSSHGLGGIR
jgi:AcrR family transcriptional regulator